MSQIRVVATDAGKLVLSVMAALGGREKMPDGFWAAAPDMPPPDACVARCGRCRMRR